MAISIVLLSVGLLMIFSGASDAAPTKCCDEDSECKRTGDGICNLDLNNELCGWDSGDCCPMISINHTDRLANTSNPYFKFPCNTASTTISGDISFSESFLLSLHLTLNGSFFLQNLNLNSSTKFSLSVLESTNVTFANLTLNQVTLDMIASPSSKSAISYLNISSNNSLSLNLYLNSGTYTFTLHPSDSIGLNFTIIGNSHQNISSLQLINVPAYFSVSASSYLQISDSFFVSASPPWTTFDVSNSTFVLNSSDLVMESPAFPAFNLQKGAVGYMVGSKAGNCAGNQFATVEPGSEFVLKRSEFNRCEFKGLYKAGMLQVCAEGCDDSFVQGQSYCPDGKMDMFGCKNCPDGLYRFNSIKQIACFTCTEAMNCSNGIIRPNDKYYRMIDENYQHVFRECPNSKACKGNSFNKQDKLYFTNCSRGYEGRFCAVCSSGYTKVGQYVCGACPEANQNIIFIILIIAFFLLLILYMIKTTVITAFQPGKFYSIGLKIGINYFQVIFLCLQYKLKWPSDGDSSNVGSDGGSTGWTTNLKLYFSFKCLFNQDLSEKEYFYVKVALMAALPIILLLFSIFYLLILHFSKRVHNIKYYQTVSILVPFLLIYPYVITSSLSTIACNSLLEGRPPKFDEKSDLSNFRYLLENPEILCTWKEHFRLVIWVTIFSISVWGIGTPAWIFLSLYRHRKNLFVEVVKYRFGFLINGYLHERFLWEFLIFIKKLIIVLMTVFVQSQYNTTLQSVLLIVFLIGAFILQLYYEPYITNELNNLENLASCAAMVTVFSAIIYSESGEDSDNMKKFFIVVIAFVNIVFTLYWLSFMTRTSMNYFIENIEFLRVKFWKSDGFDRKVSKEFTDVNYIYIKEFQKLYTQITDNDLLKENYVGDYNDLKKLMAKILYTKYEAYKNNQGPIIRSIKRTKTKLLGELETLSSRRSSYPGI